MIDHIKASTIFKLNTITKNDKNTFKHLNQVLITLIVHKFEKSQLLEYKF